MGAIGLKNHASANINSVGGGSVVIRGGRLQLTDGSTIESKNTGPKRGGNVDVRLTGALTIQDGQIRANVLGSGAGGDVNVDARTIGIDGQASGTPDSESANGIVARVAEGATGHGGMVTVHSDDISINAGAGIRRQNFGEWSRVSVTTHSKNSFSLREGKSLPILRHQRRG
jgi:hypothetical protein